MNRDLESLEEQLLRIVLRSALARRGMNEGIHWATKIFTDVARQSRQDQAARDRQRRGIGRKD